MPLVGQDCALSDGIQIADMGMSNQMRQQRGRRATSTRTAKG